MSKPFFERLKVYFEEIGKVLRGESLSASIFPNTSDIGLSRELLYIEFLKQHAPLKCDIFLGGFLFGDNGDESKQIDVIISCDIVPRFNFNNKNGVGKSFSPVKGCLGVVSVKSNLDKAQLWDSLSNLASIPELKPLGNFGHGLPPGVKIRNYQNWPYKVIYATDGLNAETLFTHLDEFYKKNNHIPLTRRPDLIHIVGKYIFVKIKDGIQIENPDGSKQTLISGEYKYLNTNPDTQALTLVINELQQSAQASALINYNFNEIVNSIHN